MRLPSFLIRAWCHALMGVVIIGAIVPRACAQTPAPNADTPADDQSAAIRKKATDIIIPRLEFHNATLPDAIEKWRKECRRLDRDPDRARRGINLFVRMPPDASPLSPVHINLTLKNISVLDALRYIALQAGLKMEIEWWGVSLAPAHDLAKPIAVTESPTATLSPTSP